MLKEDIETRIRLSCERALRKIGIVVEDKRVDELVKYAEELSRWNKAYNLVGRNLGAEGLASLIVDAISPLCLKGLLKEGKEVIDIGSGAGLPGIPLYLLAEPFSLTLVESQRKKITFLRHIRRFLDLEEVKVYPGRVEEMAKEEDYLNAYEVVLSRAVMDPIRLIGIARHLICEGGQIVIFVGKSDAEKIKKTAQDLEKSGMKVEAIRSTQRIVGKEHFLAVASKTKS